MNANQFTQKSLEAIQSAQDIAQEYGNQQIEQVHLLSALLRQEDGLIPQLLTKMGLTVPSLNAAVNAEIGKLPKVSVSREAGKIYVSPDFNRTIQAAEESAKSMKDEFVSVEHLLLGLITQADFDAKKKQILNL